MDYIKKFSLQSSWTRETTHYQNMIASTFYFFFVPKKNFKPLLWLFALYYTFFLSSLLTNSIHNYYKCYHFCFFSFLPLFLACSIIDKGYLGFVSITNYSDCFDKLHNKTRYSNTCIWKRMLNKICTCNWCSAKSPITHLIFSNNCLLPNKTNFER